MSVMVWDLPLRLFHWLLVVAIAASVVTGEIGGGLMDIHGRLGVFILGLLVFRLVWGFLGTTHSRFSHFFPTPKKIQAYLKGHWHGHGHNPLGALSVFALLGVLILLVGAGLFANDDIAFQGPLFSLVDKSVSDKLSGLHELAFNVVAALIVLHIAAIAFYVRVKKHNLIVPMFTGKKEVAEVHAEPVSRVGIGRLVFAVIVAGSVVVGVSKGAQYFAPAVVPTATQNW